MTAINSASKANLKPSKTAKAPINRPLNNLKIPSAPDGLGAPFEASSILTLNYPGLDGN